MVVKFVYISSLAFSGSTLLDLVLGGHPNIVGLGEIGRIQDQSKKGMDIFDNRVCSCGKRAYDCEFWSHILKYLKTNSSSSKDDYYQFVVNTFIAVYGTDAILIDSSKYNTELNLVRNLENIDLYVLQLSKDVRSFTISHLDHSDRRAKVANLFCTLYLRVLRSPNYLFWKWYLRNRKIKKTRHAQARHVDDDQGVPHVCRVHPFSREPECHPMRKRDTDI